MKRVYCDEKFVIMYAQKGDNLNIMENKELALHAKNIRRNIVKEVYSAQSGHPGGSLGATDILTELYFEEMDINEENLKAVLGVFLFTCEITVIPLLKNVLFIYLSSGIRSANVAWLDRKSVV